MAVKKMRLCSCGQDIDQFFDIKVFDCGCECGHIWMKRCWPHNCEWLEKFLVEYNREYGYRWEREIKLVDKQFAGGIR